MAYAENGKLKAPVSRYDPFTRVQGETEGSFPSVPPLEKSLATILLPKFTFFGRRKPTPPSPRDQVTARLTDRAHQCVHMFELPVQIRRELLDGPISSDGLFGPLLQSATNHLQTACEEADRVKRHTSWSKATPRPQRPHVSWRDRHRIEPLAALQPGADALPAAGRFHHV
ncbi:inter-alpha-trypsin inhibitor heavy chain H3-like [Scomber scombrus]|uniref:Inter-alpha-trypsin inhibitor heavy chain H3-like n=1 Tax=Scomber scombrus TaxID=13677 RepID=A0AAV1NK16_SCOSC